MGLVFISSALSKTWLWSFELSNVKMIPIFISDYILLYVMLFIMIMPCLARRVSSPPPPKRKVSRWISASNWEVTLGYHERTQDVDPSEFQARQVRLQTAQVGLLEAPLRTWKCSRRHWTNSLSGGPSDASRSLVYCCALTYISSVDFINLVLTRLGLGRQVLP